MSCLSRLKLLQLINRACSPCSVSPSSRFNLTKIVSSYHSFPFAIPRCQPRLRVMTAGRCHKGKDANITSRLAPTRAVYALHRYPLRHWRIYALCTRDGLTASRQRLEGIIRIHAHKLRRLWQMRTRVSKWTRLALSPASYQRCNVQSYRAAQDRYENALRQGREDGLQLRGRARRDKSIIQRLRQASQVVCRCQLAPLLSDVRVITPPDR